MAKFGVRVLWGEKILESPERTSESHQYFYDFCCEHYIEGLEKD